MTWQMPKRSVLVPFDFTEPSAEALKVGATMVENNAGLHVLYVLAPPSTTSPGAIWGDFDESTLTQRAEAAMREEVDEAVPGATLVVKVGDPADAIVGYAADKEMELVVLPSHGRRGFERWLLGSVSERVVRLSPCPVLVLRRPVRD